MLLLSVLDPCAFSDLYFLIFPFISFSCIYKSRVNHFLFSSFSFPAQFIIVPSVLIIFPSICLVRFSNLSYLHFVSQLFPHFSDALLFRFIISNLHSFLSVSSTFRSLAQISSFSLLLPRFLLLLSSLLWLFSSLETDIQPLMYVSFISCDLQVKEKMLIIFT